MTDPTRRQTRIAVVGGGVVGVILTLGLLKRGMSVDVFEQGSGFREVGAGIAFTNSARRCMSLIDPSIVSALARCGAVAISDDSSDDDYLRWIDGFNMHDPCRPAYQKPWAKIGGNGFRGCRRDQFLEELAKELPADRVHFRKRVETLEEAADGSIKMVFADGETAEADAVIGCDGIKSRVRPWVIGPEHPACQAQYTHKVAYRGLVPMDQAIRALGEWTAHNFHHHVGPGAHVTHYPVANHTALNTTVFLSDAEEWPDSKSMVVEGGRDEVLAALHDWHPNVLALVGLLPASLIRWALFDQHEYPVPRYYKGRVCIAGDAAHASSPHHGAGACAGVEDALCLCTLFDDQQKLPEDSDPRSLDAVCASFDALRRTRTQWLVNSSRRACDLYHQPEWADPTRWAKAETCFEELRDRSYKIWDFDADAMVADTRAEYQKAISELSSPLSIPGSHRGARGQSDRQVEVGLANL